jgi:hypothetical protein
MHKAKPRKIVKVRKAAQNVEQLVEKLYDEDGIRGEVEEDHPDEDEVIVQMDEKEDD